MDGASQGDLDVDRLEREEIWISENHPKFLYDNSVNELNKVYTLIIDTGGSEHTELLYKSLFTYGISVMEAYLSDVLQYLVVVYPHFLENAINNVSDLQNLKFKLSDIYKDPDFVTTKTRHVLAKVLYHKADKVIGVYGAVLGVKPEIEINDIARVCETRHDVVHRNGKTLEGELINIDIEYLVNSQVIITRFITAINSLVISRLPFVDDD